MTVASGVTLTVEPGVVVKLNGQTRRLRVTGSLSAIGTQANPIIFTSLKDDAVGGDDGGDGPTVGAKGDWYRISFDGSSSSTLRWVTARFGGYGSAESHGLIAVDSASSSVLVEDSTISDGQRSCVALVPGSSMTIKRSSLINCNQNGLYSFEGTFALDQVRISGNVGRGIKVVAQSTFTGPKSTVNRSTITGNGDHGILLFIYAGVPATSYPSGSLNNIYANGSTSGSTQLQVSFTPPAGVDWRDNHWGFSVKWYANKAACAGTSPFAAGYLADYSRTETTSFFPPYIGAISAFSYSAGAFPNEVGCKANKISIAPFDFVPFMLANGAPGTTGSPYVPVAQTLGPAGVTVHAKTPTRGETDPVTTATGNFSRSETDLRLYGGVGVPFAFQRTYNALDPTVGALGVGWTHELAPSLQLRPNGDVSVRDAGGALLDFALQSGGGFAAAAGVLSKLEAVAGGYELTRLDQVKYVFSSVGKLNSVKDRNGRGLTLGYDGSGRLATVTDAVSRQVTFTYNGSGYLSQVTLPGGRNVSYGYTTTANVTRLTSVTDARGKVWSYTYESHGLLEKMIDPNANTVFRNVYGDDGRVTDQYDGLNNRGTFTWNPSTQTFTYTDARGKQWRDVYSNNALQKLIDPLGNETRFEYDAAYNVTKVIDGRGHATTMTYDTKGNMLTRTAPTPLSYAETWTYTARNDVATYQDGRGNTTSYGYDTEGNLTSVTSPDPDGAGPLTAPVVTLTRDPAGTGLVTAVTDPRSKTTTLGYTQGNLTSVTTQLGYVTTYGYDGTGRRTSMVEPRGNVSGGTPSLYTTSYVFDNNDNATSLTTPLGHVTSWVYDNAGRLTSITDANTRVTGYGYNAADRLTTITAPDPDGGGPLAAPVTTNGYDAVHNLTSRTDANNHQTTFEYDDANRLTAKVTPLGKRWSYAYDAANNPTSVTDANGNATTPAGDGVTTLTYDQLNRVSAVDYSDTTPDVSVSYDANSNLTQLTDGAGTETRSYDTLNRLMSLARGSDTFSYEYDAASNLSKRTYPGSVVTDYSYDNDERLATVTANSATTSYGYDEAGNLTTITLPSANGHTETRVFDRSGRLSEVHNAKASTTLSRFQLTRDAVGNPTQIIRTGIPSETRTYIYDNMHRLKEVCYQAAACSGGSDPFIRWSYDGAGNRLTETRPAGTTSYSYDNDDRLTTAGSTTYSHDHNGNQTAAGSRTFTWDLANRLKTTTLSGTTTTYSYTADGRRTQATTGVGPANTTNYLWDTNQPLPQLAIERDGSGTLLRRYTHGADRIAMSTPAATYYYHHDDLRSVANLTDTNGAKQWTYNYDPYGTTRTQTQDSGTAPTNPMKFTGEHHDPTGLYHLRARQYDPSTGRFATRDIFSASSGLGQGVHETLYGYVGAMPTTATDPSGNLAFRPWNPFNSTADRVNNAAHAIGDFVIGHPAESLAVLQVAACATGVGCFAVAFAAGTVMGFEAGRAIFRGDYESAALIGTSYGAGKVFSKGAPALIGRLRSNWGGSQLNLTKRQRDRLRDLGNSAASGIELTFIPTTSEHLQPTPPSSCKRKC